MLSTIEPRQDQLNTLFEEIFPEEMKRSRESPRQRTERPSGQKQPDDLLIQRAMLAKNGNDFEALWRGSTLGYTNPDTGISDDSAADMALMNMLAFWTSGNAAQMERLFSRSGLGQRDKWRDRPDYRERTIKKAISDAREFYKPSKADLEIISLDGSSDNQIIEETSLGQDSNNIEKKVDLDKSREILKDLAEKVKKDPGELYEPEIFEALREIHNNDHQEWERVKKVLRSCKISVRDLVKELKKDEEESRIIQTPFRELEGGKLAEMVVQYGIAKFAVYDPATQNIVYVPELEIDEARIIPPISDEIFLKGYISLPSKAENYGDELKLYNEIQAFVHKYLEVSGDYEVIACFYPMLTWVYDVMSVIVYLRARGDWGTGKSRFLAVFCAICYRAISATGAISEAPIFRIMDKWSGTMGIDEADFNTKTDASATISKILNCGYEKGKPVIRCDANDPEKIKAFDPFGPKIIATRYEFTDKALESRCFTEIMKERTRKDIPIELPPAFYEEALRLRNKLLMYRFKNRDRIRQLSEGGKLGIDFSGLPDRMQQAARPISVVVGDHPELQAMLKKFLEDKTKALVQEAAETTEGHIVKILADEEPGRDNEVLKWELTIGNIFERIKAETGDVKLKSGQVRAKANSLGLKTTRDYVGDKRQRIITCNKALFDRLKRRYIPVEPDISYIGPDSPYWGLDIVWDKLDDLDNEGVGLQNTRDMDGRGIKPERREEVRMVVERNSEFPPCDRPDCPDRPKSSLICAVCDDELVVDGKILKGYCQKNGLFYCAQPGCGYPKRGEANI